MGGQVAIGHPHIAQPFIQHQEMPRLIGPDAHPVIDKRIGHGGLNIVGKPADNIEGQINGVQFDMRQSVQLRFAAVFAADFAPWHVPRCQ